MVVTHARMEAHAGTKASAPDIDVLVHVPIMALTANLLVSTKEQMRFTKVLSD